MASIAVDPSIFIKPSSPIGVQIALDPGDPTKKIQVQRRPDDGTGTGPELAGNASELGFLQVGDLALLDTFPFSTSLPFWYSFRHVDESHQAVGPWSNWFGYTGVKLTDSPVVISGIVDDPRVVLVETIDWEDGTIKTDKVVSVSIADSAVITQKINDAAVATAKIADDAVTFDKIAANSIAVEQLFVGSFDNLVMNPGFEQSGSSIDPWGTNIANGVMYTVSTDAPRSGANHIRADVSGQTSNSRLVGNGNTASNNVHVAATEGDQFYCEGYIRCEDAAAANQATVAIIFRNAATSIVNSATGSLLNLTQTYQRASVTGTAGAGTKTVEFYLDIRDDSNDNDIFFDDAYARRMVTGDIVVDGTITADHINVATLSAIAADIGIVTAGIIRSSDSDFTINLGTKLFSVDDENGQVRVEIGQIGAGANDYGIRVTDDAGLEILKLYGGFGSTFVEAQTFEAAERLTLGNAGEVLFSHSGGGDAAISSTASRLEIFHQDGSGTASIQLSANAGDGVITLVQADLDVDTIVGPVVIADIIDETTDLDNFGTEGTQFFAFGDGSTANIPAGVSSARGAGIHWYRGGNPSRFQMIIDERGNMWSRGYDDGGPAWNAWRKVHNNNAPAALVSRSSAFDISTTSSTVVQWNSENHDIGGMVNLGANNTFITVPANEDGAYLVGVNMRFNGLVGSATIRIMINGGLVAQKVLTVSNTNPDDDLVTYIPAAVAGDDFTVEVQSNDSAYQVLTGARFWAQRIA